MFTEISRIVNEDISSRVTQYDVIFEAITNAIHSNSTDIKCFLNFNGNLNLNRYIARRCSENNSRNAQKQP